MVLLDSFDLAHTFSTDVKLMTSGTTSGLLDCIIHCNTLDARRAGDGLSFSITVGPFAEVCNKDLYEMVLGSRIRVIFWLPCA